MGIVLNSTGGGSVTLQEPNTASALTLNLPAASGSLITESMMLLGTLTTTSGTTQTLSGLDLTGYKQLFIAWDNVSITGISAPLALNSVNVAATNNNTQSIYGITIIALLNGAFMSLYSFTTVGSASSSSISAISSTAYGGGGKTTITNSTTSITVSGGTFDAGTISVYGVK